MKKAIMAYAISALLGAYSVQAQTESTFRERFAGINSLMDESRPATVIKADSLTEILKRDLELEGIYDFLGRVRQYDDTYNDDETRKVLEAMTVLIVENAKKNPVLSEKYLSLLEKVVNGQIRVDESFRGRDELKDIAYNLRGMLNSYTTVEERSGDNIPMAKTVPYIIGPKDDESEYIELPEEDSEPSSDNLDSRIKSLNKAVECHSKTIETNRSSYQDFYMRAKAKIMKAELISREVISVEYSAQTNVLSENPRIEIVGVHVVPDVSGIYMDAIDDLTTAIRMNPKNKECYELRAKTYCKLEEYKKANDDFRILRMLNKQ